MAEGEDWLDQIKRLGQQLAVAFAKFVALLVFIGMHRVLDAVIGYPKGFVKSQGYIELIVGIAFTLLYVDQLWEMLAVFIPRLGTLHARFTRGDTRNG